jgi:oligopeptide/dipeptide ABC transporter ATP-binding protein
VSLRSQTLGRRHPVEFRDIGDPTEPLLVVEDLHTAFRTTRGTVRAVEGVSLTVRRGETLGIVGESGSGKTVLARSIMGLLPRRDVVKSGTVTFAGHELTDMNAVQLRQVWGAELSMIFQDPMTALNPVKRIGKQITESLRLHLGMDRAEANAQAIELLRSVGIPSPEERIRWYPFQLSGGMRQRVMIAIALACAPRLVMADEPTTGLDVTVQAQILDLLAELQHERHMAVMLVTHDLGVVASRTDNIVVMYAGRIVEQAPTQTLFADTHMPYTRALMDSIPRLSEPSGSRLRAIAGRPPDLIHPPPGCRFAPRCPYAQDRCRESEPPLRTAGRRDHLFACWFPLVNGIPTAPSSRVGADPLVTSGDPPAGPGPAAPHAAAPPAAPSASIPPIGPGHPTAGRAADGAVDSAVHPGVDPAAAHGVPSSPANTAINPDAEVQSP